MSTGTETGKGSDDRKSDGEKAFYPDLKASPIKGSSYRFFEVEITVNNNTLFKSLVSLLHFVAKHGGSGYLVFPTREEEFATKCLETLVAIIRAFGKTLPGRDPQIPVAVVTVERVAADETKHDDWDGRGRKGRPPECAYLPRTL
jgi:hypothetical protein